MLTFSLPNAKILNAGGNHGVNIGVEEKRGGVPSQRSLHYNFVRDGRYNERGWACTPYSHQPRLILPSRWNVAIATLGTLWQQLSVGKLYSTLWIGAPYTGGLCSIVRAFF
jgi:hypothetical protein